MSTKSKHRMVVEITTEQKNKLNKFLAYGEQRRVFSTILADVLDMLDEFGHSFVIYMLRREFSYKSIMLEQINKEAASHEEVSEKNTVDQLDLL